jgi:hypothetical protein
MQFHEGLFNYSTGVDVRLLWKSVNVYLIIHFYVTVLHRLYSLPQQFVSIKTCTRWGTETSSVVLGRLAMLSLNCRCVVWFGKAGNKKEVGLLVLTA